MTDNSAVSSTEGQEPGEYQVLRHALFSLLPATQFLKRKIKIKTFAVSVFKGTEVKCVMHLVYFTEE